MSLSPSSERVAGTLVLLTALLWTSHATAQTRVGGQWITSGLSVAPTLVTDRSSDGVTVGGGLRLRLGFQHVVARQLIMAAEVEFGDNYMNASTIAPDGAHAATHHFAWQAGLVGRWVPRGDLTGPALGIGLHTFRASFPEAPVQALSGDLRFGWYLWRKENFVLAELGYAVPFLEGVDAPTAFDEDAPPFVEQEWMMHRFLLGFSYGF